MLELLIIAALLALGLVAGSLVEQRHYRQIRQRERQLQRIVTLATRQPPALAHPVKSQLVTGSVVVSVDYFKRFVAQLRNLFGGRVTTYESLLDRGRREAILRMKATAARQGASFICNVKLETSRISQDHRSAVGSVEVLAYGTALIPVSPLQAAGFDLSKGQFL